MMNIIQMGLIGLIFVDFFYKSVKNQSNQSHLWSIRFQYAFKISQSYSSATFHQWIF